MLLVNITANPNKITYDDANSFGMTRVTLHSVAFNVYDTKLDEIIEMGSLSKDSYTECDANDHEPHRVVKFTRKTRTMQMMDELVDRLSKFKHSVIITDGPDWMRQFLHPLAFKFGLKE